MNEPLRFGRIEVDPRTRDVKVDGKSARLGARAFDVLMVLIEHRDRVVSKGELLDLAWAGLVVEENNLQVQVSLLRKAFGPQVIATVPGRGYRFTARADADDPATVVPVSALREPMVAPGNLPDLLPPLYGRDADLRTGVSLLEKLRLVTITGAGGIGKTRLAQALAHALRDRWSDGVWMIDLASTIDPSLVPGTVAQTMRLSLPGSGPMLDEVLNALRHTRALLVLDNCEHVLAPCTELTQALLARAAGISILTTTQEPLHLPEEHVYRLDTLAVPASVEVESAAEAGAVALFLARAAAADRRFDAAEDLGSVIEICRRLDGLALAIELAAARVPVLGVQGLLTRLNDRFRLLTGGARFGLRRHQTLHAALDWSYGLLNAQAQYVFRNLGTFTGGFTLRSAQHVAKDDAADEWGVLDHLGELVDKSLVQVVETGAEPRYRLLESSRAFALERLRDKGETAGALKRHALAMLDLFELAYVQHWPAASQAVRDRYFSDLDNVRAALDWAASPEGSGELMIALAGASGWVWGPLGARLEGLRRHAAAMERVEATTPPALEARLLLAYSYMVAPARLQSEEPLLERAAQLYRSLGDRRGLFSTLLRQSSRRPFAEAERGLAEAASLMDDSWPPLAKRALLSARAAALYGAKRLDECREVRRQVVRLDEAIGDPRMLINSLGNLADLAFARDDIDEAIRLGREALAYLRREWPRMRHEPTFVIANLGAMLTRAGRLDEALQLSREGCRQMRASGVFVYFLEHYALLAFKSGRIADAAKTAGYVTGFHRRTNARPMFTEVRALAEVIDALRRSVSADELERLFREGEALSAEEVARIALDEPPEPSA